MKHKFKLEPLDTFWDKPIDFIWDQKAGTFAGPAGGLVREWVDEAIKNKTVPCRIVPTTFDVPIKDPKHKAKDLGQVLLSKGYLIEKPLDSYDLEKMFGPWPEHLINPETGEEDPSLGVIIY